MNKCGGENYHAVTEVKVPSIQRSQISRRPLLSESSQASLTCPSAEDSTWISVEHWWNYNDGEKTLYQSQFVHHRPHTDWPAIDLGQARDRNWIVWPAWSTVCDTHRTENPSNVQSRHNIVINATIFTGHKVVQNNTVTTWTRKSNFFNICGSEHHAL